MNRQLVCCVDLHQRVCALNPSNDIALVPTTKYSDTLWTDIDGARFGRMLHGANLDRSRARILNLLRSRTAASLQTTSVILVAGMVCKLESIDTISAKETIRIAAENVVGVTKAHHVLNTPPGIWRGV